MSQKLVYLLLKELGGSAFPKQIKELAKKKYPNLTLHSYVNNRLRKLANWNYVHRNPDGSYTIIDELKY